MAEQGHSSGQPSAEPARKSALFIWARRVLLSLALLSALTAVAAASIVYLVDRRGGIEQVVGNQLSARIPGLQANISALSFHYDVDQFRLILSGHETELNFEGQHVSLDTVDFIFGLSSLRTVLPEEIAVKAHSITVTGQGKHWEFSEEFSWLNQIAGLLKTTSAREGASPSANNVKLSWPSGFGRLTLKADQLTVLSAAGRQEQTGGFSDVSLSVWPEQDKTVADTLNVSLRLSQPVDAGQIKPQINLFLTMNLLSELSVFELQTKHVDATSLLKMFDLPTPLNQQIFSGVEARLSGTLDRFELRLLSGQIESSDGQLTAGPADGPLTTAYSDLKADIDYSANEQVVMVHNLSAQLSDGQAARFSGRFTEVHSAQVGYSGTMLGEDIALPGLLRVWPEQQAADLRALVAQNMAGGRFKTVAVEFEGMFKHEQSILNFSQLNLSGEYANIRLSYRDEQYETVVGTLNGSVDVAVGADGKIQSASTVMSVRNGFLRVADYGPTIRVPSVDMVLRQQGSETVLQNLFVDLDQLGKFTLNATRRKTEKQFTSELKLDADFLDAELFQHLWPKQLAPRTISWMRRHISGGVFGKSRLGLSFSEQDGVNRLIAVAGNVQFREASFRLYQDLYAATDLSGRMKFEDNQLVVNIEDGDIDQLSIPQAQVMFGPLLPAGQERALQLKLNASGNVQTVLDILAHQNVNQLKRLQLHDKAIAGDIEFTLDLAAAVQSGKSPNITNVAFDGSMTNSSAENLPMQHNLKQANTVLSYQDGAVQISGSGILDGMQTDFTYQRAGDGAISLNLKTANERAVVLYLQNRFNLPVDGTMRLKVALSGHPQQNMFRVGISADATDTAVAFPALEWAKLPGEAAMANMQLILDQGELRHIEAIDIRASSVQAKGRLAFEPDLSLNHGYLEQVVLPGHRIDTILLERDENGILEITAEGEQINLVPLRRNEGMAKGRDLKFDVTSEKLILDADMSFNGHPQGQTTKEGGGEARLQGSLIVKDKALLSEGTVDTMFGAQGEFLSAKGVIGGAEAELTYSPSDEGGTILLITSENGGRTLDGLNVTDTVRGGRLRLATTFSADSFSNYRTEIELVDFHVVEAPRAIRAFSVLSVAGLSSLVEGEGTHFSKGQAIIEADGSLFRLKKIRAVGEAVGVHLLGTYDKQSQQIDISGDLIPLKQLSKLIGYVPFFGELLTGIDKTGIFSTQFTMKGDASDPDVGVNLFALAPGLLRDILSPDWLGGERRRILGADE